MLKVQGLGKRFAPQSGDRYCGLRRAVPGRQVLHNVSLTLENDETLAVVGPSGCGKTTLLYLLCGLSEPDEGKVTLNGRLVRGTSPDISIILQDYGLLPWKTVLENVTLGLKIRGVGRDARESTARKVLAELGLAGREMEYPARLSGGEQQRVGIARAYAMRPQLLLMDEPFSSLDAITREILQETLLATWRNEMIPFLLVTHSVEEAVFLGRRILLMAGDPATIVAEFKNPDCGDPAYRNTPQFYDRVREVRASMDEWWTK